MSNATVDLLSTTSLAEAAFFLTNHILFGQLLLPVLIGTILISRRVHRHATLPSLLVGVCFSSFASSLLFYTGHMWDPNPPQFILVLSWTLDQAGAITTGIASLMHVLHLTFRTSPKYFTFGALKGWRMFLAYILPPYVAGAAWIAIVYGVDATDPSAVTIHRNVLSCAFGSAQSWIRIVPLAIQCGFACSALILCIASIVMVLTGHTEVPITSAHFSDPEPRFNFLLKLLVRYTVFCAYMGVVLAIRIFTLFMDNAVPPDVLSLFVATFPAAAFLLFGATRDILAVWAFWRAPPQLERRDSDASWTLSRPRSREDGDVEWDLDNKMRSPERESKESDRSFL